MEDFEEFNESNSTEHKAAFWALKTILQQELSNIRKLDDSEKILYFREFDKKIGELYDEKVKDIETYKKLKPNSIQRYDDFTKDV